MVNSFYQSVRVMHKTWRLWKYNGLQRPGGEGINSSLALTANMTESVQVRPHRQPTHKFVPGDDSLDFGLVNFSSVTCVQREPKNKVPHSSQTVVMELSGENAKVHDKHHSRRCDDGVTLCVRGGVAGVTSIDYKYRPTRGVGQNTSPGHKPPCSMANCQNPACQNPPLGLKPPFSREVIKKSSFLTLPIFIVFLNEIQNAFFFSENTFCSHWKQQTVYCCIPVAALIALNSHRSKR